MMEYRDFLLCTLISLMLFIQGGSCADSSSDLPNWLVGTIAVCVFLVLAFAFMVVNYYFCADLFVEDEDLDEEEAEGLGYENHVHEIDEDMPKVKVEGAKKSAPSDSSDDESKHEYSQIRGATPNPYENERQAPLDDVLTTAL